MFLDKLIGNGLFSNDENLEIAIIILYIEEVVAYLEAQRYQLKKKNLDSCSPQPAYHNIMEIQITNNIHKKYEKK